VTLAVVNIAVLTRRSMKSSTNHYLSALAVYDVLYLALVLVIILHQDAAGDLSWWYWLLILTCSVDRVSGGTSAVGHLALPPRTSPVSVTFSV